MSTLLDCLESNSQPLKTHIQGTLYRLNKIYLGIYVYTYMHTRTINEKRGY